jgi:hypothetical protein
VDSIKITSECLEYSRNRHEVPVAEESNRLRRGRQPFIGLGFCNSELEHLVFSGLTACIL